jgi:DNA-directed RNA polymerase subunit RPC12/RpoP
MKDKHQMDHSIFLDSSVSGLTRVPLELVSLKCLQCDANIRVRLFLDGGSNRVRCPICRGQLSFDVPEVHLVA